MVNNTELQLRMAQDFAGRGSLKTAAESFPLVAVMLMAFLGNTLVLWAVKGSPRLRTTPNYYVVALACTDVLMSILVMPVSLSVLIAGRWPFNAASCAYHGYMATTLGSASLFVLTFTAVNRYFKVVRPNQYRTYFKVEYVLASLFFAWLVAGTWPIYFVVKGIFRYHPGKFCCIYDLGKVSLAEGLALNVTLAVLTFLVISLSYFRIFLTVRKHNMNLSKNKTDANSPRISTKDLNVTTLLFALVVVYVLCWLPLLIVDSTELFTGPYVFPRPVYMLYSYMVGVNCAINPVVYGFLNREFKAEFKSILTRIHVCRKKNVTPLSHMQTRTTFPPMGGQ